MTSAFLIAEEPSQPVSRLRSLVSFARRRYFVTAVGVAGILTTWGLMMAFSWSAKLGVVSFAPWVALIGFDAGFSAGFVGAALAMSLWLVATNADSTVLDGLQIVVRSVSLAALGIGSGLAGRLLRVSERAHANMASLQSALIDATLDGICLTDEEGNILISNRPLRRLAIDLGLPAEGTVSERLIAISDSITEPERYRKRMLELAHEQGSASSDEFEVAKTGRVFRGYTASVPPTSEGFKGRIWTLREVTADRELDRMRDAFIATVSHELRTPLTSIAGFLEMMQEEEALLGETGRQYLEVIRRSTDRLHALVEDLLLVAQIEAHRVELTLASIDLGELAARTVQAARPIADEKGVTVEVRDGSALPVLGDEHRLGQVLDNLVSNALKFTNDGGSVTVTVDNSGENVRLVVADTGIGVPLDEQGQVFSRFFRSSTATRNAIPGTGLGLAISQSLVEQHGGTISFASREGEGTNVTVLLPSTR